MSVRVSVTVRVSLVWFVSTTSFRASSVTICRRCVYKILVAFAQRCVYNIGVYYYSARELILIYRPTEGGRLSRPRHCSKGVQPVAKAVCRSGCRDKHNCPRWDSNLGPLTPQSVMLPLGHCDTPCLKHAETTPGQYNRQRRRDSPDAVVSETVVQWAITTIQARDDVAASLKPGQQTAISPKIRSA